MLKGTVEPAEDLVNGVLNSVLSNGASRATSGAIQPHWGWRSFPATHFALFAVGVVREEAEFRLYDGHLRLDGAGPMNAFVIGMRAGHQHQARIGNRFVHAGRDRSRRGQGGRRNVEKPVRTADWREPEVRVRNLPNERGIPGKGGTRAWGIGGGQAVLG